MAKIIAIQVKVVRAFFHSGGLKAGTPSEIASVPVRAAQPWAKARKTRKALRASTTPPACHSSRVLTAAASSGASEPVARRKSPSPIMPSAVTMNR